jgi:hypothetical protein
VCCTTTQFPYTLNAVRTACTRSPRFMSESQRRAQKPFISEQRTLMLLVACDGVLYPRSAASTHRQPGRRPECRGVVCTCWPLKQCLGEGVDGSKSFAAPHSLNPGFWLRIMRAKIECASCGNVRGACTTACSVVHNVRALSWRARVCVAPPNGCGWASIRGV